MIKLKSLLESKASEEAKKHGLTHKGFGNYADKEGNIVARTEDDDLVWIGPKPDAEKKSALWKEKARRIPRTKMKIDKEKFKGGTHPRVTPTPEGTKTRKVRTINGLSFNDFNADNDPFALAEPIVENEEIVFWDDISWGSVNNGTITMRQREVILNAIYYWTDGPQGQLGREGEAMDAEQNRKENFKDGAKTGKKFFNRLEVPELNVWLKIKKRWQGAPQYWQAEPEVRKVRNMFINKYLRGDKPEDMLTTHIVYPLERGMILDPGEVKKFLESFKIGDVITLPPCGYSADPSVARTYSNVTPSTESPNPLAVKTGILLRLHSRGEDGIDDSGTVIGYPLSNKAVKVEEYKRIHPDAVHYEDKDGHNFIKNYYDDFTDEYEVIRPGFASQRVDKVTKHIFPQRHTETGEVKYAKILYVIDMVEAGAVEDESQIAEVKKLAKPIKKFYKYLNTRVGRKPRKLKNKR